MSKFEVGKIVDFGSGQREKEKSPEKKQIGFRIQEKKPDERNKIGFTPFRDKQSEISKLKDKQET